MQIIAFCFYLLLSKSSWNLSVSLKRSPKDQVHSGWKCGSLFELFKMYLLRLPFVSWNCAFNFGINSITCIVCVSQGSRAEGRVLSGSCSSQRHCGSDSYWRAEHTQGGAGKEDGVRKTVGLYPGSALLMISISLKFKIWVKIKENNLVQCVLSVWLSVLGITFSYV